MKGTPEGIERRGSARSPKTVPVEVQFGKARLLGPSANLSPQGVYFLAEGSLPVTLSLMVEGKKKSVKGRVVRIGSVNEKTLGVAIRFDAPLEG